MKIEKQQNGQTGIAAEDSFVVENANSSADPRSIRSRLQVCFKHGQLGTSQGGERVSIEAVGGSADGSSLYESHEKRAAGVRPAY